jgi:hypothetical protein
MSEARTQAWDRLEAAAYWVVVLVHLFPVLLHKWFVTLDGPCHLYNARIIRDLVLGDELTAHFFRINPFPEPNWTGHAIMAVVMAIAPAWIAEKVVVLLAVIGLAWCFRSFIGTIAPARIWMSWLVMPFLISYVLRMGFFNFCLGLAVFFALMTAWHQRSASSSRATLWRGGLLLLLLYFTHLSTFVMGLATIALWSLLDRIAARDGAGLVRDIKHLAVSASLPIALTVSYHFAHPSVPGEPKYLPTEQLLAWIGDGQAWIGLGSAESLLTRAIAITFIALFLAAMAWAMKLHLPLRSHFWSVMTMAALLAFLLLPDQMAGGGIASPRLLLFAMFFMALAVASSSIPKWICICGLTVATVADLLHLRQQYESAASLASEAADLTSLLDQVPEGTIVLPLNYGDNWIHSNISNYIGASRKAIVLDNYAAIATHHPVRWQPGMEPYETVGTFATSNRPCVSLNAFENRFDKVLDLVITWKMHESMIDSCTNDVRAQLASGFVEVGRSASGNARLYRAKAYQQELP